ncbi:MAG: sodium:solute symporter family protein [Candidatus Peribacteraceae bacterium]|nr:sodium:solute symporter family protein [Candidatus Peribacteraceae bacterium]MDD5739634.1 sodium:solute symporter family protein [Candidatus Peribacteraceae bacterium]
MGSATPFLDYGIVALFFLIIFLIGVVDRRHITLEDYWVNGRKTNKFVLVATMLSTFVGAGTIFGGAGFAFAGGGLAILAAAASYVVYFFLFSRFFAGRIKEFGDRHHAFTLPDFLEIRFSRNVRLAGAMVNLVTWALFLASQILAMGAFMALLTGVNPTVGTILGALVVIAYTSIGGLRADIRTDVFQFCVMLVLLLLFFPLIVVRGNGLSALTSLPVSFLMGSTFASPTVYVLMFLFLGTGVFTSADIWQRAYAADTPKNARWAMAVSGMLLTLFFVMAIFFGVYGKILLPDADSNTIVPALMQLLLPPGLFGLVLAGFFAAILSTVDTVLLLTSMTLVHDLYQKSLKRELSPATVLRLSRWVTLLTGLVGLAVALIVFDIVHLTIEAVSFYIVLSPAIVFGFYAKKKSSSAAFWSIILGFIATLAFFFVDPVQAFIPGLIVSFLTYVVLWAFERTPATSVNI